MTTSLSMSQSALILEPIQFAKEFFITEKGELIKMAAMLSRDEDVLEKLSEQKPLWRVDMKKLKSNTKKEHYISIYKV